MIKKQFGETELILYICELVTETALFFNVGKTMNAEQIKQTSMMIAEDYYYMKPEELNYCFNKAKRGHYGKLFDRLDGAIIFRWLDKYNQERTSICVNKSESESQKMGDKGLNDDELMALYKRMKNAPNVDKKPTRKVKDELALKINGEFEMRRNKNGKVKVDGKMLDRIEFIEYRLNQ